MSRVATSAAGPLGRILLAAVALTTLAVSCAGTDDAGTATIGSSVPAPILEGRPHTFQTFDETYVDTSRTTEAGAASPELPERTLVTTIRIPDGEGPFPLIMFSHGLSGHPRVFSQLFDTWAAAGYAVAAPAFPLTNTDVPSSRENWSGLAQQPGDISFVLDQLLAANDDPSSPLSGRFDPTRIGAGGLSLGGATTYGVLFNDCCRDERFVAGMILSGATLAVSGDPMVLDGHVPLLIVHGDADASLPYTLAHDTTFAGAAPPVWFVTLLGGTHAPPYEDWVSPHDDAVEQFTTDFWDATLVGGDAAWSRFEAAAAVDGLTVLETKP